MQLHAQLRRNGLDAGIGERLHADQLARARQLREQRGQHAVDAGAHQDAVHRRIRQPRPQPVHRCLAVVRRAAEVLVTQHVVEVGFHEGPGGAVVQPREQVLILRFGRHVHGHFCAAAAAQAQAGAAGSDEGAGARARVDQAALARLGIAARHRRVVELQVGGQLAQRGQPIAHREPPGADVVGDQIGQQQIGRPGAAAQLLAPVVGDRVHGELIACIDRIPDANDHARKCPRPGGTAHRLGAIKPLDRVH